MPLITRLSYPRRKPPKTATRVANTRLVVKRTLSLADDSIADVALARSGAFGAICIGMWEVGEGGGPAAGAVPIDQKLQSGSEAGIKGG